MISSQLPEGFSSWYSLNGAIKVAPQKSGTYVIRMSGGKCFGRLQGETDIVYIGSTERPLKRRFYEFLRPGPTQWTNQRINQLSKKFSLEIAWSENDNPKIFEHNLLRQFLKEHDEFPPLNRADIRKLKIELNENITVSDTVGIEVKRAH